MGLRRSAVATCLLLLCLMASCGDNSRPLTHRAEPTTTTTGSEQACSGSAEFGDIMSAANQTIWFLSDVASGRDPEHVTPKGDWFGCAYGRLCAEVRTRVDEAAFRASGGEAVSLLLTATAFSGSRSERGEIRPGIDVERDGAATEDQAVTSTWVDVDATWTERTPDGAFLNGTDRTERWRVSLVRESGDWKVCATAKVG